MKPFSIQFLHALLAAAALCIPAALRADGACLVEPLAGHIPDRIAAPAGTPIPGAPSPHWKNRSTVFRHASEYLRRYADRRRITLPDGFRVAVSGITCDVRPADCYGQTCYAVTYAVRLEARDTRGPVWKGTVSERLIRADTAPAVTEEQRLRLVKKGINQIIRALWLRKTQ